MESSAQEMTTGAEAAVQDRTGASAPEQKAVVPSEEATRHEASVSEGETRHEDNAPPARGQSPGERGQTGGDAARAANQIGTEPHVQEKPSAPVSDAAADSPEVEVASPVRSQDFEGSAPRQEHSTADIERGSVSSGEGPSVRGDSYGHSAADSTVRSGDTNSAEAMDGGFEADALGDDTRGAGDGGGVHLGEAGAGDTDDVADAQADSVNGERKVEAAADAGTAGENAKQREGVAGGQAADGRSPDASADQVPPHDAMDEAPEWHGKGPRSSHKGTGKASGMGKDADAKRRKQELDELAAETQRLLRTSANVVFKCPKPKPVSLSAGLAKLRAAKRHMMLKFGSRSMPASRCAWGDQGDNRDKENTAPRAASVPPDGISPASCDGRPLPRHLVEAALAAAAEEEEDDLEGELELVGETLRQQGGPSAAKMEKQQGQGPGEPEQEAGGRGNDGDSGCDQMEDPGEGTEGASEGEDSADVDEEIEMEPETPLAKASLQNRVGSQRPTAEEKADGHMQNSRDPGKAHKGEGGRSTPSIESDRDSTCAEAGDATDIPDPYAELEDDLEDGDPGPSGAQAANLKRENEQGTSGKVEGTGPAGGSKAGSSSEGAPASAANAPAADGDSAAAVKGAECQEKPDSAAEKDGEKEGARPTALNASGLQLKTPMGEAKQSPRPTIAEMFKARAGAAAAKKGPGAWGDSASVKHTSVADMLGARKGVNKGGPKDGGSGDAVGDLIGSEKSAASKGETRECQATRRRRMFNADEGEEEGALEEEWGEEVPGSGDGGGGGDGEEEEEDEAPASMRKRRRSVLVDEEAEEEDEEEGNETQEAGARRRVRGLLSEDNDEEEEAEMEAEEEDGDVDEDDEGAAEGMRDCHRQWEEAREAEMETGFLDSIRRGGGAARRGGHGRASFMDDLGEEDGEDDVGPAGGAGKRAAELALAGGFVSKRHKRLLAGTLGERLGNGLGTGGNGLEEGLDEGEESDDQEGEADGADEDSLDEACKDEPSGPGDEDEGHEDADNDEETPEDRQAVEIAKSRRLLDDLENKESDEELRRAMAEWKAEKEREERERQQREKEHQKLLNSHSFDFHFLKWEASEIQTPSTDSGDRTGSKPKFHTGRSFMYGDRFGVFKAPSSKPYYFKCETVTKEQRLVLLEEKYQEERAQQPLPTVGTKADTSIPLTPNGTSTRGAAVAPSPSPGKRSSAERKNASFPVSKKKGDFQSSGLSYTRTHGRAYCNEDEVDPEFVSALLNKAVHGPPISAQR